MRLTAALFIFLGLVLTVMSAHAEDKSKADYRIAGEAQLLSHFIDKGVSYSNGNPAMNASFLFNLGSQAKIGFWGSNVSNIGSTDDTLWLKILGEIHFDFSSGAKGKFYISDDHFYSSNQHNGQVVGFYLIRNNFEYTLEWLSNFEGSKSAAEYFNFGKLYTFKKDFKYGGYVGYTNSHSDTVNSYFDLKAVGQYLFSTASTFEAGITLNSNGSQFGSRGDPAYYVGVKLVY
jgi:hypothetical protein